MLGERRGTSVALRHVQRGDRLKLCLMAARNAEQAIASELASRSTQEQRWQAMARLLDLPGLPERVECFDISHTVGEATVASCVVFGQQGAIKSDYRRFNITGVAPGDDYAAMHQALDRRFRRALAEQTALPDLLLIDGGKGQVAQAMSVLADLGVADVIVVGVAKGPDRRAGQEQLILGRDGRARPAAADDPGLHLIQHIRDEAHRFAIAGHRQRRQRVREHSSLEEIPGIGAKRRAMLLKHFGGWAGLSGAGVEELARVQGIHRALAERIYAALHG
jgi:excinuclease ABC subunit C